MHEALDEIYKMLLHNFRPEAILGVASPYYWAMPMFNGSNDPEEYLSWALTIDKIFRLHNDEDINTIVTHTTPAVVHTIPITRAHARQLNY